MFHCHYQWNLIYRYKIEMNFLINLAYINYFKGICNSQKYNNLRLYTLRIYKIKRF